MLATSMSPGATPASRQSSSANVLMPVLSPSPAWLSWLKLARCAALLTRIIDAAEFFAGGLDDLATMGGGLDIAGQKHSLAPGLL